MPISEETLDEVETILDRLAAAWFVAMQCNKVGGLTLGEMGAIAKHHLPTFALQRSDAAIARLRKERKTDG